MADYLRIGPPWGQINWIPNSGMRSSFDTGASAIATAQGWSASGGSCATTNILPWTNNTDTAVNTTNNSQWEPMSQGAVTGALGTVSAYGWKMTSATTIPSGQILAVAEFPVPSIRGIWSFQGEVRGASSVQVWGQIVPNVTIGASPWATWNVGTGMPAVAGEPGTFRWTGQFPNMIAAASSATYETGPLRCMIRAGNTIASGDAITILSLGLFQLDAPLPNSDPAIASIYAGASGIGAKYLNRPFSSRSRDSISFDTMGYAARFPAHPSYDARQPCGKAIEIGSWMRDGYDYGGAGVERRETQQTSLTDAGALTYEGYAPRIWTLPYIVDTGASVLPGDFRSMMDTTIESDPLVLDVVAQNSTWMVRFDTHTISNEHDSALPYRRQNLLTGRLVAQTAPIGYSPRPMVASGWGAPFVFNYAGGVAAIASNGRTLQGWIIGDRSAYLQISGWQFNYAPWVGTLYAYSPGATYPPWLVAASYVPSTANAGGGSNGLGRAGSTVRFSNAIGSVLRGPQFIVPATEVSRFPDTVRVFAGIANATTATLAVFGAYGRITYTGATQPNNVATTPVAYLWPVAASGASETPIVQFVDLGEVSMQKGVPNRQQGFPGMFSGGVPWSFTIFAGSGPSNSTIAGMVDSLVMLPAGPSCFIYGIASANMAGDVSFPVTSLSMWPSYGIYMDMANSPNFPANAMNYSNAYPQAIDLNALAVGPYPLLPPGPGCLTVFALAAYLNATTNRLSQALSFPNTAGAAENVFTYHPRWAFIK